MTNPSGNEMFDKSSKFHFIFGMVSGIAIMAIIVFVMMFVLLFSGKAPMSTLDNNASDNTQNEMKESIDQQPVVQAEPEQAEYVDVPAIDADDNTFGNPDAVVQVIEYSDFECPFCERVIPAINQLKEEYSDQVYFAYRHFPLSSHEFAHKAAEAAECAGDQNKFWLMHDAIFANQANLSVDSLKKLAVDLNMNSGQFNTCLDSGAKVAQVDDDFNEGVNIGVRGTPTIIINGKVLPGAVPFATLEAEVKAAMSK